MTDFRNLNQPHDLRSQLGLKNSGMTDERRISLGLPPLNEQNQESLRAEIADALRRDVKPLSPDEATPDPLHKIIAVTGCTNQDQARRLHKWFEGKHPPIGTSNVVVNVVNNGEQRMDKDASEIVASIRKMIDSPQVQSLRQLGEARKYAEDSLRIEAGLVDPSTSAPFYDVRKLSGTEVTIDGQPLQEYLDQLEPGFHCVEADKVRGKQVFLDGMCVGGMILRQRNQPTHRALSKIHDHVESLESDILEALVMAGANPHADRRRLESARTQFELAFMMMKKAVDPEQERQ